MAVGSIAFDLVDLNRRLDTLDGSVGPLHRNWHSAWALAQACAGVVRQVKYYPPGHASEGAARTGDYLMPENFEESQRTNFESAVDTLEADLGDVITNLQAISLDTIT